MDFITLAAAVIIFLATFFATVSGFGFALVAMPLLSLVMPVKAVIIFLLVISLVLRVLTMYRCKNAYDTSTVMITTLGCLAGALPGSMVLKLMSAEQMKLFLGMVLLAVALLMSRNYTVKITNKTMGRLGAGFLSSFFGTATSVSGPPLALYFLNERTDKEVMRANMIWIFGLSGFITVGANYWAGNVGQVEDWSLFAYVLPAVFAGIWAGEKLFYLLNQEFFRRFSLMVVCAGGLMLLVSGLRNM